MKTKVLLSHLTVLLSISISFAHSGDSIVIPYGTSPTIDGILSTGEWDDASTIQLSAINGIVHFKHTDTHLFVAFSDPIGYYNSTGIYLDLLHDGGSAPQMDDIWIHGSAAAFEFKGDGSTWQMVAPSDWNYIANSANEFSISLSKLGITPGNNVNMGILFSFLDWSTTHDEITWPSGGYANCNDPNSWATLIMKVTTGIDAIENNVIHISPNPASTYLFIESNVKIRKLILIDFFGKMISINDYPENAITLPDLPNGLYFVKIFTDKGIIIKKFIKK